MRFCATHNIHLVSDEIYALSIFPVPPAKVGQPPITPFTSLLSIDPTDLTRPNFDFHNNVTPSFPEHVEPGLFHVEYGLAKDFGTAGLHLGALITTNSQVANAFEAISLLHAPSGASCHIGVQILENVDFVDSLLTLSRTKLSENYIAVTDLLNSAGIPYWKSGNAGYFLWVDLSAFLLPKEELGGDDAKREQELAGRILGGGVWLNPGQEKGEKPGWFRLIFSHPKGKVLEGVRR
jgi:1-aminocyclopropane-1-carboxylate synthase